jgi:hypothetical protein
MKLVRIAAIMGVMLLMPHAEVLRARCVPGACGNGYFARPLNPVAIISIL